MINVLLGKLPTCLLFIHLDAFSNSGVAFVFSRQQAGARKIDTRKSPGSIIYNSIHGIQQSVLSHPRGHCSMNKS